MKKTTEQFIKEIFEFVCQNGLENTSIRDICKDTGMSTGSLYYRFKSKACYNRFDTLFADYSHFNTLSGRIYASFNIFG